jgi:hypothetical protein
MDFLRRRLRGGAASTEEPTVPDAEDAATASDAQADPQEAKADPVDPDAQERAYELDLIRQDQDRLDELQQRQLRYAKYAWEPPAQGGERRADDEDRSGAT